MNDEEFTDEELAIVISHAIETEHPGRLCPCDNCMEQFPWDRKS